MLRFQYEQYIGNINISSCRTLINMIPKRGESSCSEL